MTRVATRTSLAMLIRATAAPDTRSRALLKHFLRRDGCPVAPTTPLGTAQCLGQHFFSSRKSACKILRDAAAEVPGNSVGRAVLSAPGTCRVNAHHCRHCRGRPRRGQVFSAPTPTRATKSSRMKVQIRCIFRGGGGLRGLFLVWTTNHPESSGV